MLNRSGTRQPILFVTLLHLELMYLQSQRRGFLSVMPLIELKRLPRYSNFLTITVMVVRAVELRY